MKFFNSMGPNPKLVRMFAAEKGYEFDAIEEVDLIHGANRQQPYRLRCLRRHRPPQLFDQEGAMRHDRQRVVLKQQTARLAAG